MPPGTGELGVVRRQRIDWGAASPSTAATADEHDRTHRRVLALIEQQILEGSLRAGDRLPGERELASLLGVSRTSVREALRALESMGIVARGPGRGPNSGCIITGGPSGALSSLLRLHLALAHFSLADLVEVRVQLEIQAVRQSAGKLSVEADRRLQLLVEEMADTDLSPAQFNVVDTQFHIAVSQASGNPLLHALMQALRDAVQREMVATSERLEDWPPMADKLRAEHQAIANAMRDDDKDLAAALVEAHIRGFYGSMASRQS
ncbi:MAG TPA: FCD domain-containing protein [Egibacteraceae bacterium]|nr:FCD domain-containing protein [Egibacteraceae bacterium]HVM20190.1 FCD domain-containing protein [Egibacteraceae bacterium]